MTTGRALMSVSAILVLVIYCVTVINCAVISSEKNEAAPHQQEERLDIIYDNKTFKEIEPDILQVIGDVLQVQLNCISTTRSSMFVEWYYHGMENQEKVEHLLEHHHNSVRLAKFAEWPPVARMECVDRDNSSISNSTLIYRGNGTAPFLYKNGQTLSPIFLNETTVCLPCLLNYPLDNLENKQLQLLKDGVEVDNKNGCLSYTPENGYTLNLIRLEQPFGNYECRVANSTDDKDYVKVELTTDELIQSEIEVKHQNSLPFFFKGNPNDTIFLCTIPTSRFQDRFEWFYLLRNGSYIPLQLERRENASIAPDVLRYFDSVRIKFNSTDITHVACLAYTKNKGKSYNNTVAVEVREPKKPKIINRPTPSADPIFYSEWKNLTCEYEGDPVSISWLKNGEPCNCNVTNSFDKSPKESSIELKPLADDVDTNYTCVAKNFLGRETSTYRVQLKPEPDAKPLGPLVTVGICLVALIILILLLFTFYQIKLERRQFSKEKIRLFFNGSVSTNVPYSEVVDESQEAFESVPYYKRNEIKIKSLKFVKELKEGNFGKVQLGYYCDMNTGSSVAVAIKSIKDNRLASQDDLEYAFENFLKEIKLMQMLGEHSNVVKYIGAVTSNLAQYSAYLVVEYCSEGDLCTYLRTLINLGGSFYDDIQGLHSDLSTLSGSAGSSGTEGSVSAYSGLGSGESVRSMNGIVLKTSHLMKWAEDIASGMEYVASKRWVHRDLAARNILLAYEGSVCINRPDPGLLTAKISDFGLSKDLQEYPRDYYPILNQNRNICLPLRWMSVEALETLKFSTYSDVWAYGVTLWEMFTLGESPYLDFMDSETLLHDLIGYFKNGDILRQPEFAPPQIWEVMSSCWNEINGPTKRPNFASVKESLHDINANIDTHVDQEEDSDNENAPVQPMNTEYQTVEFVVNLAYQEDENQSVQSESQEEESETEESLT